MSYSTLIQSKLYPIISEGEPSPKKQRNDSCIVHYITQHDTLHTLSGWDPFGSHTSKQTFVYMLQTQYTWLQACTWRGSVSYNFSVTPLWISICQHCVFQNFVYILMMTVTAIVPELVMLCSNRIPEDGTWCQNVQTVIHIMKLHCMACVLSHFIECICRLIYWI
jgi:hypothetical protein